MGIGNISVGKLAAASDVRMLQTQYNAQLFGRVNSAASGNVAYTGYGFKPKALFSYGVRITAGVSTWTIGVYASTCGNIAETPQLSPALFFTDYLLMFSAVGPSSLVAGPFASVTSLDADGFTLMWTGSNTSTLSVNFVIMACGDTTSV